MNTEKEAIFQDINTPRRTYFSADSSTSEKTPNQLYAQYELFCKGNGKTPMTFKEWLAWAKQNGIIAADGKKRYQGGDGKFQSFTPDYGADSEPTVVHTAESTPMEANTAEKPLVTEPVPPVTAPKAATPEKVDTSIMDSIKSNKGKYIAGAVLLLAVILLVKGTKKKSAQ